MQKKDPHQYDDMLHMTPPISKKHPKMSLYDRAAQFSPFSALNGHEEAIEETGRRTDAKKELDEHVIERLNDKLIKIGERILENQKVRITYFVADEKKAGGTYYTITACVKKIDTYRQLLILDDNMQIPIKDLYDISADWLQDGFIE